MSQIIPPSPVDSPFGSYNWADWYEKVRRAINGSLALSWAQITNFTGSNLTQIVTRLHNTLQSIQGGNGTTEYYHLTNADYTAITAGYTGTGLIVRQTTPTLITPVLGAATGTSIVWTKDGNSFQTNLATSAGFNGIRLNNEAGARRLEILYNGSTGSSFYGITSNDVVYNTAGGAVHNFSVSDALVASIKATGIAIIGDITTSSTTLHKTSAALTNGAAAAVGTLNNAPVAGNPTKWVPINDNGTVRYIPCW